MLQELAVASGQQELLRVNPNWASLEAAVSSNGPAISNSNSAQIELERKYSNGMAFQWFYTYTRALTTADKTALIAAADRASTPGAGGTMPENRQIMGSPA